MAENIESMPSGENPDDIDNFEKLYDYLRSNNITAQWGRPEVVDENKTLDAEQIISKIEELRNDPDLSQKEDLSGSTLHFLDAPELHNTLEKLFLKENKK